MPHPDLLIGPVLILVLGILVLFFVFGSLLQRNFYSSDDNSFSQAGVQVNFSQKTITIRGFSYPVSAIRGLRWQSYGNVSKAFILVDDMRQPVYSIQFASFGDAEVFVERLSLALRKAGGPTFS